MGLAVLCEMQPPLVYNVLPSPFVSVWFWLRRRIAKKGKLAAKESTTNGIEDNQGVWFLYGLELANG
jgi:hypothetical protein